MKKHLKIMACYFRLNLASALEYRASFAIQAFGMAISNSSFIFFWWIAFERLGGTISGYSFRDVLFIWSAASASYGLGAILFNNVGRLTNLIVTGELDTYLLQPCDVMVNMSCAGTSLSAYGDLAYGFILMAISQGADIAAWGWFLAATIIGAFISKAIALTAHTLTFFMGDASMVAQMSTEFLINFSIYPERMYAPIVRAIMYTVIPAGFISHIPLSLARGFQPWLAVVFVAASAAYMAFAAWFFKKGLKRYESGNAIATRL